MSSSRAAPPSPLALTQQKVPPTPPATPAEPSPLQRPLHPPPPPPKQKPQVPRKPQTKRVSFTSDRPEEFEPQSDDTDASPYEHDSHDDWTDPETIDTNACEGVGSLLIRNRTPPPEMEMSKPVIRATRVLPADLIIPPPPLFDSYVSDTPFSDGESESLPPITVIPQRILLPEPAVAETSMQSTSTNSPETEVPPPINFEAYPELASAPIILHPPPSTAVISEVPPYQVFRRDIPPNEDYTHELSVSPSGEPGPPALLHAQYSVLPTVSHVPHSPCNLHPDQTYDDSSPPQLHNSLRDLRTNKITSGMVHSITYPPVNPYPSLTTVAGTYNPYTCTVPGPASNQASYASSRASASPTLMTVERDINANVAQAASNNNDRLRSVSSERRVRFGEVVTAPTEPDASDGLDRLREGSRSPASTLKPAWSSKVKAFAIGEVNISVRHLTLAHTLGFF